MNMYYENMEITNEAFGILKTVIDTMEKKCEMIKAEMNEAVTVKDQIEVVKKLKNELARFKANIQKTKPNFFDSRCYRRLKDILGATIFIILTPVSFGISLLETVGCIINAVNEPTADIVKMDAIKSIDVQIKNCDSIINHLKESKESVVEEGFIEDFKENMKHNKEMRKENRQVKKDYNYFKRSNRRGRNTSSKFDEINNDIRQVGLSKKYPTQVKLLHDVASKLEKEFNKVLKNTKGKATTGELAFDYDYKNNLELSIWVYIDQESIMNEFRNNNEVFDDIYNELCDTRELFINKHKSSKIKMDNTDKIWATSITIRIQDTSSPSVESFILFCDSMFIED